MIWMLTMALAAIVFGFLSVDHPVLAWHLGGLIALLGGVWSAYESRVNGPR